MRPALVAAVLAACSAAGAQTTETAGVPARSRPAGRPALEKEKAVEQTFLHLERMAAIDNWRCRTFAGSLATVMAQHGVELPPSLRGLKDKAGAAGELAEKQKERFQVALQGFVSACAYGRAKDPSQAGPLHRMNVGLLATVARKCPTAFYRLEAARILWQRVFPDAEGRRAIDEMIAPAVAADAADAALTYALRAGADGDAWPKSLGAPLAVSAAQALAALKAMRTGSVTKASVAAAAKEVLATIRSFKKPGNSESFNTALALMERQVSGFQANDSAIEELDLQLRTPALLRSFFAAVNEEDAAAAARLVTKPTAQKLSGKASLRAAFSGAADAAEVRLTSMAPVYQLGGQLHVEFMLAITNRKGKSVLRRMSLPLTKSKDGLLIGGE